MDLGIKQHVAIVTGAGNGIGAAIARNLASEGCRVAVLDRDVVAARRVATSLSEQGWEAIAIEVDVADPQWVQSAVDEVFATWRSVHILVNNAGFSMDSPVCDMTDSQWKKVLDVSLGGAFHCVRAVAPHMLKQGYGRIVNMSSRAHHGDINKANYSAAKAGLIGLTKALSLELGPSGITVNAVAPGIIETERLRALAQVHQIEARSKASMPIKRFGHVDEVARTVLFFAAETSGFITGETIHVSGGRYG